MRSTSLYQPYYVSWTYSPSLCIDPCLLWLVLAGLSLGRCRWRCSRALNHGGWFFCHEDTARPHIYPWRARILAFPTALHLCLCPFIRIWTNRTCTKMSLYIAHPRIQSSPCTSGCSCGWSCSATWFLPPPGFCCYYLIWILASRHNTSHLVCFKPPYLALGTLSSD